MVREKLQTENNHRLQNASHARLHLFRPLTAINTADLVLPKEFECRQINPDGDRLQLAELLLASFTGSIDDEDNTFEDAISEIDKVFSGRYGLFKRSSSLAIVDVKNNQIQAATLLTHSEIYNAPLLVFVFTAPSLRGRGFARCLISKSAGLCTANKCISLPLTEGNEAAMSLYRKLGFIKHA